MTTAAMQFADKLEISPPVPKGTIDFEELAVSLKRYPDTKLSLSANCKADIPNQPVIAALKRWPPKINIVSAAY